MSDSHSPAETFAESPQYRHWAALRLFQSYFDFGFPELGFENILQMTGNMSFWIAFVFTEAVYI